MTVGFLLLQIVHENKVLKKSRLSIKKISSDAKLAEVSSVKWRVACLWICGYSIDESVVSG